MTFTWATGSHKGRVRDTNEDTVYPPTSGRSDGLLLVAVADGIGGHAGGEVASATAIAAAIETEDSPRERLLRANAAVLNTVAKDKALAGMGTTLTLLELSSDHARIAHVGDSRAYLLRDGVLRQLTEDHSVVAEYLRMGAITPEEVETHPQRSMLTRAIGLESQVEVDVVEEPLQIGDRLMVCSDGLTSMISDDAIRAGLASGTGEEAVWNLIEAANVAGGYDNVTLVIVDVT